jgi:hypothetical protein
MREEIYEKINQKLSSLDEDKEVLQLFLDSLLDQTTQSSLNIPNIK